MAPARVSAPKIEYPDLDGLVISQGLFLEAISNPNFYALNASLASLNGKEIDLPIQRTIICESNGNHYNLDGSVKKGKYGEIGIAQYLPKTWQWLNEIKGTDLNIYNPEHQIEMMEWAFENGYQRLWVCYNKIYGYK